jgi:hypothetical protein
MNRRQIPVGTSFDFKDSNMVGSTIIAESDPSRLARIQSIDDLDNFVCLNLDVMGTIDFAGLLADSGFSWSEGDPIQFDPDGGMAIFKLNADGLTFALTQASKLDQMQQIDLRQLAEFLRLHGSSDIYELATF